MIEAPARKPLSLILAMADDGTIGHEGKIPWHIPEDLKRFKELTMGRTVIMGRKTWESLPPNVRPLPGRRNIVVSRAAYYDAPGAHHWRSLEGALDWARFALPVESEGPFVIGGAEIYRAALPMATRIYLTRVDLAPLGDTRLRLDMGGFVTTSCEDHRDAPIPYSFVELERVSPALSEAA